MTDFKPFGAADKKLQERDKLQGLLAKKQDQALESLSAEEIAARIKALEGAA